MKTKFLLITLAMTGTADAAVYRYDYEGLPLTCRDVSDPQCLDYATYRPDGWRGSLIIDSSAIPGGSLVGASINLSWYDYGWYGVPSVAQYSIVAGNGVRVSGRIDEYESWPGVDVVDWQSDIGPFLYRDYQGYFNLSFDSNEVLTTEGRNMVGGSNDPSMGAFGDCYHFAGVCSSGPGVWTRTLLVPDVPLPASAYLLLSALAGIFGLGRKKRRNII